VLALGVVASACAPLPHTPRSRPAGHPARPGSRASGGCVPNGSAGDSYIVFGHRYQVLRDAAHYHKRGIASWYGKKFHGKLTSSGQPYDMYAATGASKVLPLCTWVKVTNLENGKNTVVQVNDRGPFVAKRIIDLSYAAAKAIGMIGHGTAVVNVDAIAQPSRRAPPDLARKSRQAPTPVLHHRPRLYLQLGAFAERANAERLRAKLLLEQAGPVRIEKKLVHGKLFYRVELGPYATVAAIDRLAARMDGLGYHDSQVDVE
jgi:rare lipoprotein A